MKPDQNFFTKLIEINMVQVDELREKRTTWTMRGWRETLKDGTQVMRAEPIPQEKMDTEEDKSKEQDKKEKEKMEEGDEDEEEEKDDEGFDEKGDEAEDVTMEDGEEEEKSEEAKEAKQKKKKMQKEMETAGGKSTSGTISKVQFFFF
jgi:hypothetical protein